MIPPEWILPIIQSLIIAVGSFVGIAFGSWLFIDRKVDKKAEQYAKKARESSEGKDAITILKEVRKLLEGSEVKDVLNEIKEAASDARVVLKALKKRFEAPVSEDGEEEVELPTLVE